MKETIAEVPENNPTNEELLAELALEEEYKKEFGSYTSFINEKEEKESKIFRL